MNYTNESNTCQTFSGLLSLCMIARDNKNSIPHALQSAKQWVDQIVVIDTGSVDETPEIADRFGALVEYFPWCDDFSSARNYSLQLATCEWIFWMDTDDVLPSHCGQLIRQTLEAKNIPEDVLGLIMQVHCPDNVANPKAYYSSSDANELLFCKSKQNTGIINNIENTCPLTSINPSWMSSPPSFVEPSAQPPGQSGISTIVDHVKIFRNKSGLKFEGRIHEQILPAIRRNDGRVIWTDAFVVHASADYSSSGMERKLDRDLRLLRIDAVERPNHPFVLFNLGMTLLHKGAYDEACQYLRKCVEISTTEESHLRKAYVLLADSYEGLKDIDNAQKVCWEGLGRFPEDAELSFKLGRILMYREKWQEAINAFQRSLSTDRNRYFASLDPAIKGYKAHANLAICYTELDRMLEAVSAWKASIHEFPNFIEAWTGILEIFRKKKHVVNLSEIVTEFDDNSALAPFVSVCLALQKSKDSIEKAIAEFQSALLTFPDNHFLLDEFARFLNENELWNMSLTILEKLRDLDPFDPAPQFNLGVSLFKLGRLIEAEKSLSASLELRPNHYRTLSLIKECQSGKVQP